MIFMVFRFSGRGIGWNGLFLPGWGLGRGCSDGGWKIFFESVGPDNGQGGGRAGYRPGWAGKSLRDKGLLARIVDKGSRKNLGGVPVLKSSGGNDEKADFEECVDRDGGCGVSNSRYAL